MKKKLQEAYMPDKETQKKRVIVGLSGGLNSYVTAYLLKIQKFDLIGVTVMTSWENEGNSSQILSCHLDQSGLDKIREFCHQLGIPHFVVKANEEFREEVVESWVASRIIGSKSIHCWNCHELRMRLLYSKMLELEGQGIATGHLGKLFRHEGHHSVYLHTSNDEQFDQSALLSRLPHEILDKLMLPLSDLAQKEIEKLGENFGLTAVGKTVKMHECLNVNHLTDDFLEAHVPKKYKSPGEIVDLEGAPIGDHEGVIHHIHGEKIFVPHQRHNESYKLIKYSMTDHRLKVAGSDYFKRQRVFLNQCHISEETPWIEPMKGVMRISDENFAECWIYPKNLSSAVIEFLEAQVVQEGEIVTLLKKKGRNSKVYLTGKLRYIPDVEAKKEGDEIETTDYSRDF